nr:unnamed protein product [Callosobruchus analis]
MDTAASTSRKRKHPRQSARYLSERELQQEAEKIMKGEESDESYIDFSDSGSQWEPNVDEQQDLKHEKHTLTQTEERTTDNRKKRNRCIGCYTKLQTQKGRSTAQKSTKKVSTKCNQCNIFLCFTCFTERH